MRTGGNQGFCTPRLQKKKEMLCFVPSSWLMVTFTMLTSWLTVIVSSFMCVRDRWSKDISSLETSIHDCCRRKDSKARSNTVIKQDEEALQGKSYWFPQFQVLNNETVSTKAWDVLFTATAMSHHLLTTQDPPFFYLHKGPQWYKLNQHLPWHSWLAAKPV